MISNFDDSTTIPQDVGQGPQAINKETFIEASIPVLTPIIPTQQYGQSQDSIFAPIGIRGIPTSSIIAAQISSGTFMVANNTDIQCTGMSIKLGDSSLTGTADQITIQTAGVYQILASTRWTANVGGLRNTHVFINGALNFSIFGTLNSGNLCTSYGFKLVTLAAGDVITLKLYQNSGSDLNTDYNNLAVIKLI